MWYCKHYVSLTSSFWKSNNDNQVVLAFAHTSIYPNQQAVNDQIAHVYRYRSAGVVWPILVVASSRCWKEEALQGVLLSCSNSALAMFRLRFLIALQLLLAHPCWLQQLWHLSPQSPSEWKLQLGGRILRTILLATQVGNFFTTKAVIKKDRWGEEETRCNLFLFLQRTCDAIIASQAAGSLIRHFCISQRRPKMTTVWFMIPPTHFGHFNQRTDRNGSEKTSVRTVARRSTIVTMAQQVSSSEIPFVSLSSRISMMRS
jgi:hypothetical protein